MLFKNYGENTNSLLHIIVVLLQDPGLHDLLDLLLLLQLVGADLLLELGPDAAVRLLEPLEHIGVLVVLVGLGGHPDFGLLLEERLHLALSLNRNLGDQNFTLEK